LFYLFGIVPARFSYGVKAVANELDVKLPGSTASTPTRASPRRA
jgi:hypothetical protein